MERYINPAKIRLTAVGSVDENGDVLVSMADVRKAIAQTPSADVAEVRRGKWEIKYKFKNFFPLPLMDAVIACSACGYEPQKYSDEYKNYKFCPMCGAQMEQEGNR